MMFHCSIVVDSNFINCVDVDAENKDDCLKLILKRLSEESVLDHPSLFMVEIDIISDAEQKIMRDKI